MSPAAVTPHGGPEIVRRRSRRSTSPANRTLRFPVLETRSVTQTATYEAGESLAMRAIIWLITQRLRPAGATVRTRTSANDLRRVVSRPWNSGVVWMAGIAPATAWESSTSSAAELHPDGDRSGRLELHQRPRGSGPRALRLSYTQKTPRGLNGWNRTSDLVHPKHALSLLSYVQMIVATVAVEGIEPHVRPRLTNGPPRIRRHGHRLTRGTASRASSQSTESNRPIGGYEPRSCASTDCDRACLESVTGVEPV